MSWNDGGVPNGARKVKFYAPSGSDASGCTQWGTAKGIYILESWEPNRPQNVQNRQDESGDVNGGFGKDGLPTAPATVQLDYESTDPVDTGWAFTTKRRGTNGASESWVVTNCTEPEAQGQIRKQAIQVQKLVKTPSGNLPAVYP